MDEYTFLKRSVIIIGDRSFVGNSKKVIAAVAEALATPDERTIPAHFAVLGANIIYGANYTIAKEVMPDYIEPFGFIVLMCWSSTTVLAHRPVR